MQTRGKPSVRLHSHSLGLRQIQQALIYSSAQGLHKILFHFTDFYRAPAFIWTDLGKPGRNFNQDSRPLDQTRNARLSFV